MALAPFSAKFWEFAYLSDFFSEHIWGKLEELTVLSSVGNTKKARRYTVINKKLKSNQCARRMIHDVLLVTGTPVLFIHLPSTLSSCCLLSSYPSGAYWMSAPIIGSVDVAKSRSRVSEKLRAGSGCDDTHP